MPGFDGTGPRGIGPMTGGGRGFCAIPLAASQPRYTGMGYYSPYGAPFFPQMTREQELDSLRSQAQAMREQLKEMEARIQQLRDEA